MPWTVCGVAGSRGPLYSYYEFMPIRQSMSLMSFIRSQRSVLFLWALLLAFASACGATRVRQEAPIDVVSAARYVVITDSLEDDPDLDALVAPFREVIGEQMSTVIGNATGEFVKAQPESSLGNLVADAMLDQIQALVATPVDVAVTNAGGLRVPIPAGPVPLGTIYELMPFENWLMVITLSATGMDSLAQQMARRRGEPTAGWSFLIDTEAQTASDIRVGGEPLQADRLYRIVTTDYLVSGGGGMPALQSPLQQEEIPVLLRDAIASYIREQGRIEPLRDGRLRFSSN